MAFVVVFLLAWSPWLREEDVKKRVARNANFMEQHQKLDFTVEIHVFWIPFGRLVTTIEGAWFVTFWGRVI